MVSTPLRSRSTRIICFNETFTSTETLTDRYLSKESLEAPRLISLTKLIYLLLYCDFLFGLFLQSSLPDLLGGGRDLIGGGAPSPNRLQGGGAGLLIGPSF
ncbi:hypothetical protein ACOSQ3_014980 [Xanthoceras sorbifolium]